MSRESRKMEHISHALDQGYPNINHFDEIKLLHHSIPELNYDETRLESRIGELKTSSPILINGMTGGAYDTKELNRSLAKVAKELNLPMAVGSQMAAIKNPDLVDTYAVVREENPEGTIFANLGSYATVDEALQAVEMINADGLQIHLNVMQELIMPEGDRDFSGTLHRIEQIVSRIEVPVIVKEVGFGMPYDAMRGLKKIGVSVIDVGGSGGTNFAAIENKRGGDRYPFLNEWGIPTPMSLLEAERLNDIVLIASGGIRHGLDIAKSLSLGASMVGMAGRLLQLLVNEGMEAVIAFIKDLHHQIRLIMTATGSRGIEDLRRVPLLFTGKTLEWCNLRGIDPRSYARRPYPME